MKNGISLQKVSVIVPVYNAEKNIEKLIDSLIKQDYPSDSYEIIFIDNNSTDSTYNLIKKNILEYPIKLFKETNIQSSYAARNRGILNSSHDILAFTDSDCIANPKWILNGVETLIREHAGLVGGAIQFYYSDQKTASEMYDSISGIQTKAYIHERNAAPTANLFVNRALFEKLGPFPDDVKSGGDLQWTYNATKKGYKLVYSDNAIVYHPSRTFTQLLRKQFRAGTGLTLFKTREGDVNNKIYEGILRFIFYPTTSTIDKWIQERGTPEMRGKIMRMLAISYLCKISYGFGFLLTFLKKKIA